MRIEMEKNQLTPHRKLPYHFDDGHTKRVHASLECRKNVQARNDFLHHRVVHHCSV